MNLGVSPIIEISPWEIVLNLLHLITFFALFLVPIIALIIWFFTRKKPGGRKRIFKILAVSFVITLIVFVFLASRNFLGEIKKELFPGVPPHIKQISDQYIIERVGQEYFDANFTFLKKESAKDDSGGVIRYYARYDFVPLEQYTPDKSIRIVFQNGEAVQGEYDNQVPNCAVDESLCNFKLTKEEFLVAATENKIFEVLRLQPPYLRSLVCPEGKVLLVDYRNGEVLVDESEKDNTLLCFRPVP